MTSDTTPEDEFRTYCERLTEAQLEELIVSKLASRMNAAREAALARIIHADRSLAGGDDRPVVDLDFGVRV